MSAPRSLSNLKNLEFCIPNGRRCPKVTISNQIVEKMDIKQSCSTRVYKNEMCVQQDGRFTLVSHDCDYTAYKMWIMWNKIASSSYNYCLAYCSDKFILHFIVLKIFQGLQIWCGHKMIGLHYPYYFSHFHRLIFKHRVMVKAKLGRSVHMDIQKFKVPENNHSWNIFSKNAYIFLFI